MTATAGGYHTCGIQIDGSLWCWGWNNHGQLGDGTRENQKSPVLVDAGDNSWTSIAAGGEHTCGVKSDGSLWCWGNNEYGQLGDNTTSDRNVPNRVGDASQWSVVTAGEDFTCAFTDDGSLWCWGWNMFGQIGDGSTRDRWVPTPVSD